MRSTSYRTKIKMWTTLTWILVHIATATHPSSSVLPEYPCNIDRVDGSTLTSSDFATTFLHKRPVLLYNLPQQSQEFTNTISRTQLRKSQAMVLVGSASSRLDSYTEGTNQTLSTFLKSLDRRKRPKKHCASVYDEIFFKNRPDLVSDFHVWDMLSGSSLGATAGRSGSMLESNCSMILSVGGTPSGLTFHQKGDSVLLLLEGKKRWFLYSEEAHYGGVPGGFRDDTCGSEWAEEVLPTLNSTLLPMQCVQEPGEVMYVPQAWWHATTNIDVLPTIGVGLEESFPSFLSSLPVKSPLRMLTRGEELLMQDDVDAAIVLYEEGVFLHPLYHPMWNNLGAARLMKDRHTEKAVDSAMGAFFNATQANKRYKRGWLALGRVLMGDTGGKSAISTTLAKQRGGVKALLQAARLATNVKEKESLYQTVREIEEDLDLEEEENDDEVEEKEKEKEKEREKGDL